MRIFPRGRHMQRQHIAFGKERIKGHILRKRADVFAFMQIVRQNAAAKPRQTRNDGAPDPAGPRDADGQARQFAPLHAGQRIILHRRMAQNGFTAAHRHQNQHQRIIRDAVGGIADIADMHANLLRVGKVNVVVSDCTRGEIAHPGFPQRVEGLRRHGSCDDARAQAALRKGSRLRRRNFVEQLQRNAVLFSEFFIIGRLVVAAAKHCDLHRKAPLLKLPFPHRANGSIFYFVGKCSVEGPRKMASAQRRPSTAADVIPPA